MDKLTYEVIPPPLRWTPTQTAEWIDVLLEFLDKEGIRTVNIPEVVSESRTQERTVPLLEKIDTLDFIDQLIQKKPTLTFIPNKITVHLSDRALLEWVGKAYEKGVHHLILVGGEKSSLSYPGLGVTEAARAIKKKYPDITLGGITIFTRKNEPRLILEKMDSGMDFFVSQIIYETANLKCVLLNLDKLCRDEKTPLPRIYLSLAAAAKKTDIAFLEWLGVEFPTALHSYFMNGDDDHVESRVDEMIDFVLEEIQSFILRTHFDLGCNIEQIMYQNRGSAANLVHHVKSRLKGCL
jgi:5,10-methylenetetrahydrofolate reductase